MSNFYLPGEILFLYTQFIDTQDIPHLLFAGKPGAGKTTIAKILVNNINCDYLYINAADERSIDVMREKVGAFASAGSFKPLKIVILDEPTSAIDKDNTIIIKNAIKELSKNNTLILITHDLNILSIVNRVITLESGKIIKDEYNK